MFYAGQASFSFSERVAQVNFAQVLAEAIEVKGFFGLTTRPTPGNLYHPVIHLPSKYLQMSNRQLKSHHKSLVCTRKRRSHASSQLVTDAACISSRRQFSRHLNEYLRSTRAIFSRDILI